MGSRAVPTRGTLRVPASSQCWVDGRLFFSKEARVFREWRERHNENGLLLYVVRLPDGREVSVNSNHARVE